MYETSRYIATCRVRAVPSGLYLSYQWRYACAAEVCAMLWKSVLMLLSKYSSTARVQYSTRPGRQSLDSESAGA